MANSSDVLEILEVQLRPMPNGSNVVLYKSGDGVAVQFTLPMSGLYTATVAADNVSLQG